MKRLILVFTIIFSLLFVNLFESECYTKEDSFNKIENIMLEECDFVQNGIKVEYTTNDTVEEEKNRIVSILRDELKLQINYSVNSILAFDENNSYNITLFEEEATRVEIVLLNTNKDLQISDLRQAVKIIKSNNSINERYFSFIKGKLKQRDGDMPYYLTNEIKEDSIEELDINNGITVKATLNDDTRVNIGQINYNTGSYLIIGTPIIFVTY